MDFRNDLDQKDSFEQTFTCMRIHLPSNKRQMKFHTMTFNVANCDLTHFHFLN